MSDARAALKKLWELPTADPLPRGREWVYFLEAATLSVPLVKIGKSASLKWRVITVQYGCPVPLKLIGAVSGPAGLEKVLHAKFEALRRFGEWFLLDGALRAFIAALPKGGTAPLPDIAAWVSETGVALAPLEKGKPRSVMEERDRVEYDTSVYWGRQ